MGKKKKGEGRKEVYLRKVDWRGLHRGEKRK